MATLAQPTVRQPNDRPSNARTSVSESSPTVLRDTGFPEPLSKLSNTTLPHKDALTGPGEELDTSAITESRNPRRRNRHQNVESIEAQMYNNLEMVDAEEYEKCRRRGKFKKILHKLPCTH